MREAASAAGATVHFWYQTYHSPGLVHPDGEVIGVDALILHPNYL